MDTKIFLLGSLAELGLVLVPALWRFRYIGSSLVVSLIGIWAGLSIARDITPFIVVLLIVSIYRIFNILRVGKNSVPELQLVKKVRRSSLMILSIQLLLYLIGTLSIKIVPAAAVYLFAQLQLVGGLSILLVTAHNLYKTKYRPHDSYFSDKELPTVSVAIPARNETDELSSCIETILSNNYPKLEVLVLDDCSQDRTAEIIKSYAHDGVRFLEGRPLANRWLAKNQAYDQLTSAASGQLILFCGVDVRLGPDAIRTLVTTLIIKKREMLSVMPLRLGNFSGSFFQPLRYWWELALPRRFFNRPPVLSTCWLIKKKTLKQLGGFKAVSRTIIPEGYFARELIKRDSYAFIRADGTLDVRTVKSMSAQLQTAIRTRYPSLRNRPENVLLIGFVLVAFFLMPFVMTAWSLFDGSLSDLWPAVMASAFLVSAHHLIVAASNPANAVTALFNFPFAVLTELVLVHMSMYRYEFSRVQWKGRNICLPAAQPQPKPKLLGN